MNCKQFSLWARVSVSNNFRGLGFRCIGCKTLVLDNSDLKKQPHTKPSPKKLKLSCVIWVSRWCQPWSTQVVGASACSLHQPCCPGSVTAAYWPPMWPCSTLHFSLSLRCMILKINFLEPVMHKSYIILNFTISIWSHEHFLTSIYIPTVRFFYSTCITLL